MTVISTANNIDSTAVTSVAISKVGSTQELDRSGEVSIKDKHSDSMSAKAASADKTPSLSPAEAVLKRLRDQIAKVKEQIAQIEGKLLAAVNRANGEKSSKVDYLQNQLNGLQGQLLSLMGAYTDAIQEMQQKSVQQQAGSIIDAVE